MTRRGLNFILMYRQTDNPNERTDSYTKLTASNTRQYNFEALDNKLKKQKKKKSAKQKINKKNAFNCN